MEHDRLGWHGLRSECQFDGTVAEIACQYRVAGQTRGVDQCAVEGAVRGRSGETRRRSRRLRPPSDFLWVKTTKRSILKFETTPAVPAGDAGVRLPEFF